MAQRSRLGAGTSISQHYDFGLDLNSSAWDGNSQQRRVRVEMREPECRNPSGTCARTKRSRLDAIWRDGAIEPLQTLERERGGISHLRLPPRCPAASSSSFRQSTKAVHAGLPPSKKSLLISNGLLGFRELRAKVRSFGNAGPLRCASRFGAARGSSAAAAVQKAALSTAHHGLVCSWQLCSCRHAKGSYEGKAQDRNLAAGRQSVNDEPTPESRCRESLPFSEGAGNGR